VLDVFVLYYEAGSTEGSRLSLSQTEEITDQYGRFVADVPTVLNGTYDIVVRVRGFLWREYDRIAVGANVAAGVDFGTLEPGDIDYDGDIDAHDVQLFVAAFGSRSGESGYNAYADADGDGVITLLDFSLLRSSYGRSSPTTVR